MDDLDTSWIETAEFQDNYERESMKEIGLVFMYVDVNGYIEGAVKKEERLDISKDRLLQLIQGGRHRLGKKYKLADLLSFHVPLFAEELKEFVALPGSDLGLKSLPIFDDISLEPSIFIFHDVNVLFFIFREEGVVLKSILKNGGRVTKKVRMDPIEYMERKKKSLKRLLHHSAKMTRKHI